MKFRTYFFFNDTATTEIYTRSLHDALPISSGRHGALPFGTRRATRLVRWAPGRPGGSVCRVGALLWRGHRLPPSDRKSTRLNSSHANISYAVFCLKKKNNNYDFINIPIIKQ